MTLFVWPVTIWCVWAQSLVGLQVLLPSLTGYGPDLIIGNTSVLYTLNFSYLVSVSSCFVVIQMMASELENVARKLMASAPNDPRPQGSVHT